MKLNEPVPKTALFLKQMFEQSGNPMGLDSYEFTQWARDLHLPNTGEILFYTGLYPNMGYLDVLVELLKLFVKYNIDTNKIIDYAMTLQKFGLSKSVKSLIHTVQKTPKLLLKKVLGKNVNVGVIEKAKAIVAEVEKINEKYNRTLQYSVKILQQLGLNVYYLGENEPDSGATLHTYGYINYFKAQAQKTINIFKKFNIHKLVSPDPISIGIMKKYYPQYLNGYSLDVKHISEVILEHISPENIKQKITKTITIHDPCYLVRYLEVIEAPRLLLQQLGLKIIEPQDTKTMTRCCGAGGLEFIYPAVSIEMAKERAQQLLDTGAELIVSPCAVCRSTLNSALKDLNVNKQVLDIPDLVAKAMKLHL